MVDLAGSLQLIKQIPMQVVKEGAAFGPLNLSDFIQSSTGSTIRFRAELRNGNVLPQGLICTSDGIINGIPAAGTQGNYDVKVIATDIEGVEGEIDFALNIHTRIALEKDSSAVKSQVWDALTKNLPIPELEEVLNRPITAAEIYYLLQRFGILTIWDVYNLEMPQTKKVLSLEGISEHYVVYDRGSCLVGAPKDLYSHERTLEDGLQTARAMAREVYNRGWTIELAGFDKLIRGAWVELQILGNKHGKFLDILHFQPTAEDLRVYTEKVKASAIAAPGL